MDFNASRVFPTENANSNIEIQAKSSSRRGLAFVKFNGNLGGFHEDMILPKHIGLLQ